MCRDCKSRKGYLQPEPLKILCVFDYNFTTRLMAETLLAFAIEKLWDLLIRESERFQGVEGQLDVLKGDVNTLRCFLKDADAKKHTSAMVMNSIQEIKEIVYDAEDIIEMFLHKKELGKKSSTTKCVIRFSCGIVETRGLSFDMKAISTRISKVIRDLQIHGILQQGIVTEGQNERQRTFGNINEKVIVGLEENITRLVSYLEEEDSSQVISIIGMGGIGKTTLARQVFNHEIVKHRFKGIAWVCVSQQFTTKQVWQTVLRQLRQDYKVSEMNEEELQEKLYKVLETQKALIVFDDIWRGEDWDRIKPIFPRERGWKVLLTSRNEGVALQIGPTCFIFKPDCLNLEDSWRLFQKIAFPIELTITQRKVDEEMEEMGKDMLKYCGGLPLAIKVLGGLLVKKYTLQDWKRVHEDIRSHLMGKTDSSDNNSLVYHVLSLSFEELPSYLKHCFLYFAHFPEDHQIRVEKLYYYWVSEGILKPNRFDGKTLRYHGESYIEDLVRRNMVISERDSVSLRFTTCHLHDMMREVCLFKAKEENFLQIDGIRSPTANSQSRRFVWQSPNTLNVEKDINNPKLRSLMIFTDEDTNWYDLSGSSFKMVQFLRVLDLPRAMIGEKKLLDSIGKLIYLRYLSLEAVKVCYLPSSLGKLKLLVYLNINAMLSILWDVPIFVPNVLMGMQDLRYLALPYSMDKHTNLELSNQVNLETLINFSTENCNLEDIQGMTRLRTLDMKLTDEASLETLYASLAELGHLEDLAIRCDLTTDDIYYIYESIIEKGLFLNLVQLRNLNLHNMYIKRFLNEKHFPPHLICLDLYNCRLTEDPMPILEKLLHLTKLFMFSNTFYGRRMVCSSGGFPRLQKLLFSTLEVWEEWVVEEGSMPLLHTLDIRCCVKLTKLPHGISFLYSLKNLVVYGEDYYNVQHIPSVIIIENNSCTTY